MRLASFTLPGDFRPRFGAVVGDSIVEAGGSPAASLLDVVRSGGLNGPALSTPGPAYRQVDVAFLPPILAPEKIICVGVNYANRNEEYKDGTAAPEYPSLFVRFPGSFVGHGQPIVRPKESTEFDYEGEIVLVIGRGGRHIPRAEAHAHIAGLTLGNDGTLRDWVRHAKFNVTQGKNFDASGSLGPWIVPASEIDLARPLRLVTRVNGELRQDDTTASMMFDFARLIEYISTFTTLKPGDLILTGTPTGAGARFDPPRWLRPGDVVDVEVAEIGMLRNTVADA